MVMMMKSLNAWMRDAVAMQPPVKQNANESREWS
jgi:hypothetical protein